MKSLASQMLWLPWLDGQSTRGQALGDGCKCCSSADEPGSCRLNVSALLEPRLLLGRRVKVYWPLEEAWFPGRISDYCSISCKHKVGLTACRYACRLQGQFSPCRVLAIVQNAMVHALQHSCTIRLRNWHWKT